MTAFKKAPWILALLLAGCDTYSLLDQFQLPQSSPAPTPSATPTPTPTPAPLALTAQTATIQQSGTDQMTPTGGTLPYTWAVLTGTLSYDGGAGTYGSVNSGTKVYTAGTSVGSFTIQVSDNLGNTATTTVTVVPLPATGFSVSNGSLGLVDTLTWSYGLSASITGFTIYKSSDGVSYSQVKTVSPSSTSDTESVLGAGTYYQIVANSGSNSSSAATAQSQ